MQGAIASHTYDPTTAIRSLGAFDSGTPDRHAEYWTTGGPCYFNGVAGANRYINCFNQVDLALVTWQIDQNIKPGPDYLYQTNNSTYYRVSSPNNYQLAFPGDTYEIFSRINGGSL
jgi:hypothetical protein